MMVYGTTLLGIVALTSSVASQNIDPESVPIGTRDTWCTNQKSSCPLLCTQIGGTTVPTSNDCDPETLNYSCVCSNNLQPNASEYSQTIPYFECTETANQCANNCASGDNNCVIQCRTANPCGAQDPKRANISTTTASESSTASASATSNDYGGFGGSAATSASAAHSMRPYGAIMNDFELLGLSTLVMGFAVGIAMI